ncbi:iron ABC transporter substrate-binding protein [Enterobacterales bacterium CwR94]|nr:iron ABC transporter substrate-binding protein [Enterobacterales bacterium CwR94]
MQYRQAITTLFFTVLLAVAPVANAVAAGQTLNIVHAQGTTAVPKNPQRVVILNPAALDITDALGIVPIGVPKTSAHYPEHLAKYSGSQYFDAGTLFEPNYEALSNAKPNLIIAGARAHDAYNKLSEIAPTIAMDFDPHNFVASLSERTRQLGEIFGKDAQADRLIAAFTAQIAEVRKSAEHAGTAMMIMINGGKMSAHSPGSRFGFVYDVLGFTPATTFPETGKHGNAVSPEFVMQANPDWLFVLDRDNAIGRKESASAQQVLDNALVRRTNAWKNQHIVYLNSGSLYIAGGIQSYSQLMTQIEQALKNTHAQN